MKKYIIFIIVFGLQVMWQSGMLYAEESSSHRAYKITTYILGDISDFQEAGTGDKAEDFTPLMITGSTADILGSEYATTVSPGDTGERPSNIKSIALSAEFDATDKISLLGAVGVTRNLWSPDVSGSLNGAWEANLGVVYKLLDNISYELHFGYMETGDLFNNRSSYSDVESIIMMNNRLTLSF
jgi:hypothetical protein